MASKHKGYWKCEYKSISSHWTEYYYVRTSAEWYYYSRVSEKWETAGVLQTFRSYMGYNTDPHVNVDGDRTFRKIPPLEIIVVCGQLCKRKRKNERSK